MSQERYSRQVALPEVGEEGQRRLSAGRVLLVGAGGLGSPAALYLAAAGVGTIGIIDPDTVALSNLQRQVLYRTADIGNPKTQTAARHLSLLNPEVRIEAIDGSFDAGKADLVHRYSFVIDATDNWEARVAIAEACHRAGVPYSHAGITGFVGQTLTVFPGRTCCYRCLFETMPPPVAGPVAGPFGVVPGVIGTIQAAEAIRYLLGVGRLLTDRLLTFDARDTVFREIPVCRNPDCEVCGRDSATLARRQQ